MNSLLAALIVSALVFIQCCIGGTRLIFSLPPYAVVALAAMVAFFARKSGRAKPGRECVAATVIFFAYILARTATSPVEYLARADYYMVLGCLAVYGITAAHVVERGQRLAIFAVLLLFAAVVEVMIGAAQFSWKDDWMPFGLTRRAAESRASGTFISSIHFAGMLELLAPFALSLAFWGARKIWLRVFFGAVGALCYFGVAMSGSRGAWISGGFSLLVLTLIALDVTRRSRRERLATLVYCTGVGLLTVPALIWIAMSQSPAIRERLDLLSQLSETHNRVYDVRIHNWAAALDQWREAPWLGTGAGTHLYYGRQFRRPALQADPEHAHSDYLELLAEYGIVGALGMAALLAAHLRSAARGYKRLAAIRRDDPYRASPELALNVGALTAFSAYAAHSAVDFNLHLPGNAMLMAFIFGILANPGTPPTAEPDESNIPRPLLWRLVLPTLGLWLALSGIPKIPGEYWCEKARVAVRDGRYAEAITFAQRGLAQESRNPYLHLYLGLAHQRRAASLPRSVNTADYEASETALRAGLALFDRDEDLWVRLGQTLDGLGRYREAREAYLRAISLDPNLGVLREHYAIHLAACGRDAEAEEMLKSARKLSQPRLVPSIEHLFLGSEDR